MRSVGSEARSACLSSGVSSPASPMGSAFPRAKWKDGYYQIVLEYERRDAFTLTEKIDACLLDAPGGGSDTGRICFYAPELSFARELVMGLLGKVRVVAPPELREELRDELKKINDFYKR